MSVINDANKNDLTDREIQVLECIVNGKSNPEISDILSISINTVKKHCISIFNKLHARNRADAAIKAVSIGIIWI